jgi:enolase-phosphatase E1
VIVQSSRGAILLDIEGTTTPISYVYDVLFPYTRRALLAYVEAHLDDDHLGEALVHLRKEWREDVARGEQPPAWREDKPAAKGNGKSTDDRHARVEPIVAYARWLMDRDRKGFGLKALQGHITRRGYEDGSLKGEVYPDVPVAFDRWRTAGIRLAIFSSGSAMAQQMLFRTTASGDLTRYLGHFFDTTVGTKRAPESYRTIASQLGCEPERVLFISDVSAELDAAKAAGCDTRLCVRGGPAEKPKTSKHTTIYDFKDVM